MEIKTQSAFNNIYRGKKVLVTGHTGFKGSWLSLWLKKLGANVVGYSLYIPSQPSHYELLGLESEIKNYTADILDFETLKKVVQDEQPDFIFHLAAKPIVRECYENPRIAFQTNVLGTINVLECLRSLTNSCVGVFITSDKCYENVEWEYGYRETDRLGGKDPYSASKAAAEISFYAYHHSYLAPQKIHAATTRAGNVIGGGDWAQDRIVPDAFRAWALGDIVNIRSPAATRPWQHVLEPLGGYLALGQKLFEKSPEVSGEAFNFGPNPEVVQPVVELIKSLGEVWKDGKWKVDTAAIGAKKEANLLKLNCDKALRRLNWRPVLGYSETIDYTAKWYAEFYKNKKSAFILSSQQIDSYMMKAFERGMSWAR